MSQFLEFLRYLAKENQICSQFKVAEKGVFDDNSMKISVNEKVFCGALIGNEENEGLSHVRVHTDQINLVQ